MTSEGATERVLEGHARMAKALRSRADEIRAIGERTASVLLRGGRVLACGNGGSAAQAEHFTGELVGRFETARPGLPAVALTSDVASLSAIANDFGYELAFARGVEAHGREGDVLFGLSTSGNSPNVIEAVRRAEEMGLTTVGLTGGDGGELAAIARHPLVVPAEGTARIQEAHLVVIHAVCAVVDAAYGQERGGER